MKRILVITWFYPPVNSSEGIVTYKLLNNSKYQYDVFTQKESASWSYGNEDYLENNSNINCIFAKTNNLNKWKTEAVEYFKRNKEKYDIVMTRSMPPESHEIGIKIKKIKPSIKLISSFGDPIDNNPYMLVNKQNNPYRVDATSSIKAIINPIRILKSLIYRFKNFLRRILQSSNVEKETLKKADMIIFNSSEQRDYMLKGRKISNIVLPHTYYDKMFPSVEKNKTGQLKIAYIGHLDNIRTPKLFLQAIKELKEENEELGQKLVVEFYGNMSKEDKVYIIDNELYDVIRYKNQISYNDSLRKMKESDYLLHIDANLGNLLDENIFFAAKLADYIGSGTPIIGITMLEGASASILRKIGALILTYSVSDIKNYLRKIIYDDYKINLNVDECVHYSAKEVAKEFDAMIEKLR